MRRGRVLDNLAEQRRQSVVRSGQQRSDCTPDFDDLWDDDIGRAGMELADAEHGGVVRVGVAADQGLQCREDRDGAGERVEPVVGLRRVAALPS